MSALQRMMTMVFLFSALVLCGQGWERSFDSGFDDVVQAGDKTMDGGMVLGGIQENDNNGIEYPFLLKVDTNGVLEWSFYDNLHAASFADFWDVISTTDGEYLMSFTYYNNPQIHNNIIQKVAANGVVDWIFDFGSVTMDYATDLAEFPDGSFALIGPYQTSSMDGVSLMKLSANGVFQWEVNYDIPDIPFYPGDVMVTSNNEIMMVGDFGFWVSRDGFVKRFTSSGALIWEEEYDNSDIDYSLDLEELPDGSFIIGGHKATDVGTPEASLLKIDPSGNQLWFRSYPNLGGMNSIGQNFGDLELSPDGGFIIGGHTSYNQVNEFDFYLIKTDFLGNEQWTKTYGRSKDDYVFDVSVTNDQGYYLGGYTEIQDGSRNAYVVKTDANGVSLENSLTGNLFNDLNGDCLNDTLEAGMGQWLIEAEQNGAHYLTITDENGDYAFSLDSGIYTIDVHPISHYWTSCDTSFTVQFSDTIHHITEDIAATALISCPLMEVSIGTPFLRRCFDNTYYIQYCNNGTQLAEDVYVEIDFDSDMIITGSSLPIASQTGNTLVFDLGDVPFGDCGMFSVDVLLGDSATCDSIPLGATHCVEAHIYPDSICFQNTLWSGASVVVDAECQGDSIQFFIENVGTAPTTPILEFFVIEDDVILMNQTFDLLPGESQTLSIPTNGSTYVLQADQEPNHPGMSMPSVAVEACATGNPILSFGFLNVFPMDDGDHFVDIDCRSNIGSYDPNDKQGFPLGYGSEHYIEKNQDIEYFIRFQNTGTDTAFTVSIDDELDESLDYTTIRPGASSHPYVYSISEDGLINFHFDNIQLPDSSVDESGSNGFVKFKVSQKKDLDLGTKIHNSAAIFFDFNPPIITNQTEHTIGENFVLVSIDPVVNSLAEVVVFPNPFSNRAQFQVKGIDMKEGRFSLYDVTGRLVGQANFEGDTYFFEKGELLSGMYFFTIDSDGVLVASGKVMKQ